MNIPTNPCDELHDLHQIAAFLTFVAYNFAETGGEGMSADEHCGMALVLGQLRDRIDASRAVIEEFVAHKVRSMESAAPISEVDLRFFKQFARTLLDGPETGNDVALGNVARAVEGLTDEERGALRDFARGLGGARARADS